MANKYKEIALNYCYEGKAELTGLRLEEIQLVLKYIRAYNGTEPSKFFVPENKRKFIVNCETLEQLIKTTETLSMVEKTEKKSLMDSFIGTVIGSAIK